MREFELAMEATNNPRDRFNLACEEYVLAKRRAKEQLNHMLAALLELLKTEPHIIHVEPYKSICEVVKQKLDQREADNG